MTKQLDGVTVAVLVADGFEQVEVTGPMRALRHAGAKVRVISLRPGRLRGMNFLWRGTKLGVDDTVFEADPAQFGALLLPGGFVNPDLLRQSQRAREFVQRIDQLGRPIAVICHGPEVLVSAGLVRDRRMTSWPGIADDIRNAGGRWEDTAVVRDGNWVSSRGPQDLPEFQEAMIELFAERATRGLPVPPRRLHIWATASRAAALTTGAVALAAIARPLVQRRVQPRLTRSNDALAVVHDLSLAASFGGMLFAKTALDPAARVMPVREDRGRMVIAPWRNFMLPAGIAMATALGTWIAGDRRRALVKAPGLARVKDGLLVATIASGVVNTVAGLRLARGDRAIPMESGVRPSADAGPAVRVHRAGIVSGYAHLFAVGAALAVGTLLRARMR